MAKVDDNYYSIPQITGNFTFADWASHYNTTVVNKLNLLKVFNGASGDGIVFTLGTTASDDPVGGETSGGDLPSGTFRCSLAEVIPNGTTFAGDVSINGTLNYDLSRNEFSNLRVKLYSNEGFTGTKGFTFGMPIRVGLKDSDGVEGCVGGESYFLGKADSINNAETFGIVSGVTWPVDGSDIPSGPYTDSNTWIEATLSGRVKGDFSIANDDNTGLAAGQVYFLSPGNSGGITTTEPTIAGQVSKPILLGLTEDEGVFLNYRGQFLQGTGTGGTGGIDNNKFIIADPTADLVRGVVVGYRNGSWQKCTDITSVGDAVGLVVKTFTLDGTDYMEIITSGHVNDIPVEDSSTGLLYVDSNGKLTSNLVQGLQKPFAVAWPESGGALTNRGVIINQNHSSGESEPFAGTARSAAGSPAWAYRSTNSGGVTYGSAINNNIMINGAFDVWQRSIGKDSAHNGIESTYFADRWARVNGVSGGGSSITSASLERKTFDTNQSEVYGSPKYYMSSTHSISGPTDGDYIHLENRIEDVRTLGGEDVTLSFHAKCGVTGSTMGIVLNQYDGSNTTTSTVARASVGTIWGKYEVSFNIPTVSSVPTGKHYLGVGFDVTYMDTDFDVAKVKLERGLVATVNEPIKQNDELKRCSRYYQRSYNVDENTHSITMLDRNSPTITVVDFTITPLKDLYFKFPVRMRVSPSITFYSPSSGSTGDAYNRTAEVDLRYTSGTNGYGGTTRVAAAGSTTIKAEYKSEDGMVVIIPSGTVLWDQISTHYVADAELDENLP